MEINVNDVYILQCDIRIKRFVLNCKSCCKILPFTFRTKAKLLKTTTNPKVCIYMTENHDYNSISHKIIISPVLFNKTQTVYFIPHENK